MRLTTLPFHLKPHNAHTKKRNWGSGRGGRPWRRLRDKVLLRDRYTCRSCGTVGGRLEVDHIINKANGGTDALDNLQTLCIFCHKTKTQNESRAGAGQKFVNIT